MIHLREVRIDNTFPDERFPFNVLSLRSLKRIQLDADVTFLVGENGSGKSTFLEALAASVELPAVGSVAAHEDPTLAEVRRLSSMMRLVWNKRVRRGFFMRSEDFFGYVKKINQTRYELEADLRRVDEEYKDKSDYTRGLARMAYARELHSLRESYGEGLDNASHGESFFTLFQSRFVPDGLYLLDEPEAPLSPSRQLTFISLISMAIRKNAQFIIATHSPIILAYPGATILSFDDDRIEQVAYDELEHVSVMRSFLENPQAYLRHLVE